MLFDGLFFAVALGAGIAMLRYVNKMQNEDVAYGEELLNDAREMSVYKIR